MTTSHTPVLPPRRILCGVAEGHLSDAAVRATARLVERTGAQAELLHALKMPSLLAPRFAGEQAESISDDAAVRRARQLREHFAHALGDMKIGGVEPAAALEVVVGDPARRMVEESRARAVDLVVLGDNGHRRQLDFGGTARAAGATRARRTWPAPRDTGAVRRVLVPLDLSDSSRAALDGALALTAALGASLRVLHVFEDWPALAFGSAEAWVLPSSYDHGSLRDSARSELEHFLAGVDWRGVAHEVRFVEGTPVETILEESADVDLVAMGTHGRTGLAAALLGGVTYAVLRRTHTPVLALRTGGRRYHL